MRQKSLVTRLLAFTAWTIVTVIALTFLLRWRGKNDQKSTSRSD